MRLVRLDSCVSVDFQGARIDAAAAGVVGKAQSILFAGPDPGVPSFRAEPPPALAFDVGRHLESPGSHVGSASSGGHTSQDRAGAGSSVSVGRSQYGGVVSPHVPFDPSPPGMSRCLRNKKQKDRSDDDNSEEEAEEEVEDDNDEKEREEKNDKKGERHLVVKNSYRTCRFTPNPPSRARSLQESVIDASASGVPATVLLRESIRSVPREPIGSRLPVCRRCDHAIARPGA
ncbi:hypothetical protein HPB50_027319 [Hyalomma asiaticum]|uniref:Uncharacterized protein n=1 Tax=Hyalomma asiaticum TaxID=266040 RepID=A0ACB7S957_HYAAI|nr:hypothetical protein HPB50_027319 [Hyalomma asiaticum]